MFKLCKVQLIILVKVFCIDICIYNSKVHNIWKVGKSTSALKERLCTVKLCEVVNKMVRCACNVFISESCYKLSLTKFCRGSLNGNQNKLKWLICIFLLVNVVSRIVFDDKYYKVPLICRSFGCILLRIFKIPVCIFQFLLILFS